MRSLKPFLTLILLLLLFGCGGGNGNPQGGQTFVPGAPEAGKELAAGEVNLRLNAQDLGDGDWSLMLRATQATDLYQIAGSLLFNPESYELISVEAGGGLGGPDEAYFLNSDASDGVLDFAYTSRFYGRINSGDLNLLRVRIRPATEFSPADFSLQLDDGKLLARDSRKRVLEARFSRGDA